MRAPAFWWLPKPSLPARLLAPLGALYGSVTAARMARPGTQTSCSVICIGNFTVGGAGKTPVALALAQLLRDSAHTPMFLSRGYGGSHRGPPHRVNLHTDSAALVGDEPLLLARVAPTIVSADRPAGAAACVAGGASVIIMDDGLQNPSLHKSLRIAVVDGARGIGNGLCLPAGPLRAPLDAQLSLVDLVIVIGPGAAGAAVMATATAHGLPHLTGRLEPAPEAVERLRGRKVHAFAGIGNPDKFFASLAAIGAVVVGCQSFPDHHVFSAADLAAIRKAAQQSGALPVTTEKDRVRIQDPGGIDALPVGIVFDDSGPLRALLDSRIEPPKA